MSSELNKLIKDTKEVYRLVRLDNDQVIAKWNEVEPVILDSFSHLSNSWGEQEKSNIMKAISSGKLQCWGVFKEDLIVVFGTGLVVEEFWGERSFLIYSIYGLDRLNVPIWHKLIKDLSKYAKEENCTKISAFTDNERVIEIVKLYGGKFKVFLEMEV